MNRLHAIVLATVATILSGTSYGLCSTNVCSAALPNDTDNYRGVGRISVMIKGTSAWQTAYQRDVSTGDPFEGSCECQGDTQADLQASLEHQLDLLRPSYQFTNVECFMTVAGGGRAWVYQGRYSAAQTEKTPMEWAKSYCGTDPFRTSQENVLLDSRIETAAAFTNDADLDGLGGADDKCDNSPAAGPNFGWDIHRSGTLLVGEDAGANRGCFAPKDWPAEGTKGMSITKQCTAVVSGRVNGAQAATEIFRMSASGPAPVMGQGDDLKAAATTIMNLRYAQQADVYAHCADGRVVGPYSSRDYGRAYAEWKAAGDCGGNEEAVSFDEQPYAADATVAVSCVIQNDADNDGVADEIDMCPSTPAGTAVFPESFSDASLRGCAANCGAGKELIGDRCELSCPGSSHRASDSMQCQCSDGTLFDAAAGAICEDKDEDKDGVPWPLDQCPNTPFPAIVDAKGCELDSDGDGVPDRLDKCPLTPPGAAVNAQGCGLDSDGDGIEDALEYSDGKIDCRASNVLDGNGQVIPERYADIIRNKSEFGGKYLGCLRSEVDADHDGIPDAIDMCPSTPLGEAVSHQCDKGSLTCGCASGQLDSDGDGVKDADDFCPRTPGSAQNHGCSNEDMNAAPASSTCPVPSFAALTAEFYQQLVAAGQAAPCNAPVDVVDAAGKKYGSVCQGSEGYNAYAMEKNLNAVVVTSPDLDARAACYVRSHEGSSIRSEYVSPLYQAHLIKAWENRELLQSLAGSKAYACQALLNDYNVHVSGYHGMTQYPRESLNGHDRGDAVDIFDPRGGGGDDAKACGLFKAILDGESSHFNKIYP